MPMSDEDRKKLAREIVRQFFDQIDSTIGTSVRKKLVYIFIGLILAGSVSLGVIKLPGFFQ